VKLIVDETNTWKELGVSMEKTGTTRDDSLWWRKPT
jgi:hypothetical protein